MEDILDNQFSFKQFLTDLEINPEAKECQSLAKRFEYLTIIQSNFFKMVKKNRNRFFIESLEKIGKTTLLFMILLERYYKFKKNNFADSPILILVYPHNSSLTKFAEHFELFRDLYTSLRMDFTFLNPKAESV